MVLTTAESRIINSEKRENIRETRGTKTVY